METQSGARTPLVDPFGRELEEWLRDAPATRAPYLADLVVPPVTGPVQRPDAATDTTPTTEPTAGSERLTGAHGTEVDPAQDTAPDAPIEAAPDAPEAQAPEAQAQAQPEPDSAFRRPRDRARHAACTPSFPEPPTRIALRIEDLAVEVDAATGRPTIERIVLLEDEVRRRDEDLARLAAWEATVAELDDPEVRAAREFARSVFADLLADAAVEADRRARAAARRAATGVVPVAAVAPAADARTTPRHATLVPHATPEPSAAPAPLAPVAELVVPERAPEPVVDRDEPVRPAPGLLAVTPVSANTRPTPLVQPATGPTVIDRAAFAAALTAHTGRTASTPVVLPESARPAEAPAERTDETDAPAPGWWQRLVARILRALGRA